MQSKILAATKLDETALRRDVDAILDWRRPPQEYSEYAFGQFHTLVLASPAGQDGETKFHGLAERAVATDLGRSLSYVPAMVEHVFDTSRLIMMRAYLLQDALLIPHRDYVEFGSDARRMVRLHVPLLTDRDSMHSEEDTVFHMRAGEIWHLDVTKVHSACNGSTRPRLSLVLDFRLDGRPIESVLRDPEVLQAAPEPTLIERPPVTEAFLGAIRGLGRVIDRHVYRDIVRLLSRVHFHRAVHAGACFDWLVDACEISGDSALVEKSVALRRFLVDQRKPGERFEL